MSYRIVRITFALSVTVGAPLQAQKPASATALIAATDLPIVAMHLREDGVPNADLQRAFDAMRAKRMPASEARDVMNEERKAVRERGPVDNFGAFVQSKLDAGLRGRALASAIRAEHVARGKGRGKKAATNTGNATSRGTANAKAAKTSTGNGSKAARPSANRRRAGSDSSVLHGRKVGTPATKAPATKAPAAKAPATKGRPANAGPARKPNF